MVEWSATSLLAERLEFGGSTASPDICQQDLCFVFEYKPFAL
jgi:hypothetical protein